jgi:hypothetical protein
MEASRQGLNTQGDLKDLVLRDTSVPPVGRSRGHHTGDMLPPQKDRKQLPEQAPNGQCMHWPLCGSQRDCVFTNWMEEHAAGLGTQDQDRPGKVHGTRVNYKPVPTDHA